MNFDSSCVQTLIWIGLGNERPCLALDEVEGSVCDLSTPDWVRVKCETSLDRSGWRQSVKFVLGGKKPGLVLTKLSNITLRAAFGWDVEGRFVVLRESRLVWASWEETWTYLGRWNKLEWGSCALSTWSPAGAHRASWPLTSIYSAASSSSSSLRMLFHDVTSTRGLKGAALWVL